MSQPTLSVQRTMPVTCSTSRLRISAGSLIGRASTLATTGTTGAFISTLPSASAIASAAGRISAQWNGALTGSGSARLAPAAFSDLDRPLDRGLAWPETTTCPGALSLATPQTSPCAASAATSQHGWQIEPEDRRHGALPDRHRLLHRLAADLQQLCRVGERERARGAERRILAERVAGDEGGVILEA